MSTVVVEPTLSSVHEDADKYIDTDKQSQLALFMRFSNDLLLSVDDALVILQASPNCEQVLGYSAESLIGRNFRNLLHPLDSNRFDLEPTTDELRIDRPEQWRMQHSYGDTLWVTIDCHPSDNSSNQQHLFIHDISEQKVYEDRLDAEQEQLRLLNDTASLLISRHTVNGRFLFASSAANSVLGVSDDDLFGRDIFDFIHTEDLINFQRKLDMTPESGLKQNIVFRVRHRKGHFVWLDAQMTVASTATATEAAEIIIVSRDITLFKQAQMQMRLQARQIVALEEMGKAVTATLDLEEVLQLVLDKLAKLISTENLLILLKSNAGWRVAAANGEFADIYLGEQFTLDAFNTLLGKQRVAATTASPSSKTIPTLISGKDEHLRWRSVIVSSLNMGSEVVGMICGMHRQPVAFSDTNIDLLDVASHWASISIYNAQLYDALEGRNRQMQHLSNKVVTAQESERSRLSKELHDESGQALTALRINLSLIRGQVAAYSAENATQLDDALDLTQATMERLGRLARAMRPIVLDKLGLDGALSSLCADFQKHTRIQINLTGCAPTLTDTANITLYRFVQESLTNIGKHADATTVDIYMTKEAKTMRIVVEDNGIGMTCIDIDGLSDGQSLGLLSMRERLTLLNGTLSLESEPGGGATLIATLPLNGQTVVSDQTEQL